VPTILEPIGIPAGTGPISRTLTELGTVDVESAFATFDGTGASGAWRPAFTVRAQNGAIIGRVFPTQELATGDSAAVTYGPFGIALSESTGGSGIQFNTDNEGGYLFLRSNDQGVVSGTAGVDIRDASDGGIQIEVENDGDLNLFADGTGDIQVLGSHDVNVSATRDANISGNRDIAMAADESFTLTANQGGGGGNILKLSADGAGDLTFSDTGFTRFSNSDLLSLRVNAAGEIEMVLLAASVFNVYDSGGNPIFRIEESGALHGKTGQTLTFDL